MPVPGAVVYTGTKYRFRPLGVGSRDVGNIWPSPVVASRQQKTTNVPASLAVPLVRPWLWRCIVVPTESARRRSRGQAQKDAGREGERANRRCAGRCSTLQVFAHYSVSAVSCTIVGICDELCAQGTGFVSGAVVKWNGSPRTTTFVGGSQLTASMPSATERNNCGSSVASGGACTVTKATGHRSAGIRIDDNGGGSPQKVTATENCSSRLMTDSPELFRGSFLL